MRLIGQQQIAALFGVTRETIDAWQKQGLPVALRGGPGVPSEYETEACIGWRIDRELKKVQAEKPQDRLARVQADKIEMENIERRGLLIPADQLEPRLRAAFVAARAMWLDAAPRLVRDMPADVRLRESLLQFEFESFLHRLADWAHADRFGEDDG
jgi:phage terminase Nu1 subunit (DNA packaging protein)